MSEGMTTAVDTAFKAIKSDVSGMMTTALPVALAIVGIGQKDFFQVVINLAFWQHPRTVKKNRVFLFFLTVIFYSNNGWG